MRPAIGHPSRSAYGGVASGPAPPHDPKMTERLKARRGVLCAMTAGWMIAAAPPPIATPPTAGAAPATGVAAEHGGTFISPMGEPFRADASGISPEQQWFRRADKNGDGRLTLLEMRADAFRFFKTLDLNHDGEIDPEELGHYEQVVAPEINVMDTHSGAEDLPDNIITSDDGQRDAFGDLPQVTIAHKKQRPRMVRGAANFSYFDLPEPVAAADSDFNRGVSAQEFDAAAQKRFLLLDRVHDGYLSYAKLHDLRQ